MPRIAKITPDEPRISRIRWLQALRRGSNKFTHTSNAGGGAWQATKDAFATQAAAGQIMPVMASDQPTVTYNGTSQITGTNVSSVTDAATRTVFGADLVNTSGNIAQFYCVHLDGIAPASMGGSIEFVTPANNTEFEVTFGGNQYRGARIWVNDVLVQKLPFTKPTATTQHMRVQLSGAASRKIRVEFPAGATWAGVKLPTGQVITAPVEPRGLRMVVAGDSFTEATGAIVDTVPQFGVMSFAHYARTMLGLKDVRTSGSGGTSWAKTNGARVTMLGRNTIDVIDPAPDIVWYAMGINGADVSAELANAAACLDATRAGLPAALIYVNGPWDSWAPGAMNATTAQIRDGLAALCANRPGVKFIDPTGVAYTKPAPDTTHPDWPGYETIGFWAGNAIRADLGLAALTG